MAKMHEILAVESDLSKVAAASQLEATATFNKKPAMFKGHVRTVEMFDEARAGENVTEESPLNTTVARKLEFVSQSAIRFYDAVLQKESTNQKATADLVVDGKTIAKDLPATFLLGMEQKLVNLRNTYAAAPTLDPALKWSLDEVAGDGIYTADAKTTFKTQKTIQSKIIVEPTKEHPAQTREWSEDLAIGSINVVHQSGMISSADKSHMLTRIDKLIAGCKKARQRANNQEVQVRTIGAELFAYIHGG